MKLRRRRQLAEENISRNRARQAKRQAVIGVSVVLLFALAAFGLLLWWESWRECVRFAQKLESIDGATFWSPVCAEYRWKSRR